ncbi:MAG TPA: hypothetical protein VEJ18_16895 [Planctomycetota bacterium]|nr:hypothetical protein [Planctomycetota bacterium]
MALHPEWIQMVHRMMERRSKDDTPPEREGGREGRKKWALEDWALKLEVSKSTVERFQKEGFATDRTVRAICRFFAIPYPVVSAESIEVSEWFELGQKLWNGGPEARRKFMEVLTAWQDWLRAQEKKDQIAKKGFPPLPDL